MFDEQDLEALRAACKAQHEADRRAHLTRAFCVCGCSSGWPAGTPACQAFGRLVRAVTAPEGEEG